MSNRLLFLAVGFAAALTPAVAGASTTFSYTGAEQTYTAPSNADAVYVVATGGAGGGPTSGLTGRGGVGRRGGGGGGPPPRARRGGGRPSPPGFVGFPPGQPLYVEVGGVGARP